MGDRSVKRLDILPRQQRAHRFDRARDCERDLDAGFCDRALDSDQARLAVERVLHGLQQKQIDTALNEALGLLLVGVRELVESDAAGDRDSFGSRSHRARHEARPLGGTGGVGGHARNRSGEAIYLSRVFGETVLRQHDRGAAESVGLNDVGASVEETVVQFADLIRARADQVLVASFELRAAEVVRAKMHVLDGRPRRAIDNDDPRGQSVAQKTDSVRNPVHG
jgi:hypothetical protein